MIRWILIILLVIVLIFAVVFVFRSITSPDDAVVTDETTGEVANTGNPDSNQNPIVVGDSISTSEGQPVEGNVLANDTDPQGDPLTVETTPINGPNNGTLQLNPDGSFVYTPNAGYVGIDGFTYQACDSASNCVQGTVQITINSAADGEVPDSGQGGEEIVEAPEAPDANVEEGSTNTTDPNASTDNAGSESTTDTSTDNSASTSTEGNNTATTDNSNTNTSNTTTDNSGTTNTGSSGQGAVTHVVKQGEWLIQIARCYGTSPETIRYDNHIPYPSWIMPDQELVISDVGSVSTPFNEPCVMFHTVVQGDTLYSLANTYEVELDMLMKANFGCYGYGYYYHPPVPTPYEEEAEIQPVPSDSDEAHIQPVPTHSWYMYPHYGYGPGYGAHSPYIYNGCYFPSYYNPTIFIDQELVIPVNLDNAGMR